MGKLKDLARVSSTNANNFAYLPPDSAFDAMRILVKPSLGHGNLPAASVSLHVLDAVLRGLRRASPMGRIVVIEGVSTDKHSSDLFDELGIISMLDKEMRVTDSDNLILHEYPNLLDEPRHFSSLTASEYIKDYDCVIGFAAIGTHAAPSLSNLLGIVPQGMYQDDFQQADMDDLLTDVYFTLGHYFHGFIVDASQANSEGDIAGKVIWGDDCLAVDEVACQTVGQDVPKVINEIRKLRKQVTRS